MSIIKTYSPTISLFKLTKDGRPEQFYLDPPQYEHRVLWDEKLDICYYEHSPIRGYMPKILKIKVAGKTFEITPWMIFDDAICKLQDYVWIRPKENHWQIPISLEIREDIYRTEIEYGLLDLKNKREYCLTVAIRDSNFYIPPEEKSFIPVTSVKGHLNDKFWKKARLAMAVAFFGLNFHYDIGYLPE